MSGIFSDIEGAAAGGAKLERALVLGNAVGFEKGFQSLRRYGVVAVSDFSGLHGVSNVWHLFCHGVSNVWHLFWHLFFGIFSWRA